MSPNKICNWIMGFEGISTIVLACIFAGCIEPTFAAGVERRSIDIWSDGTRMSGDLWLPDGFID